MDPFWPALPVWYNIWQGTIREGAMCVVTKSGFLLPQCYRKSRQTTLIASNQMTFIVIVLSLMVMAGTALADHHQCGLPHCIGVAVFPDQPGDDFPGTEYTLDFGNQDTGTSSDSRTILVRAAGDPALDRIPLTDIVLGGVHQGDYEVVGGTCLLGEPGLTNQGDPCTVEVRFRPSNTGVRSAILDISTRDITRTTQLTGTGTLAPPVITSPPNTSGTAGVLFPGYTITATNNPISFSAIGLPPGLELDTSTGLISGTPTQNGTFNTTLKATNATGSDTKILVFVIAAGVPVITSPATTTGTTGQAFDYQITATNSPTAYGATDLPPGLSVDMASGLISGIPTQGGIYAASLTAENNVATATKSLTITITLVPPEGSNATLTVPLNTPTAIDLAAYVTGVGVYRITITERPSHGAVNVIGTMATYTPVTNYFGPDAFAYTASNADGESDPAVVAVMVVGRPDPTDDPAVRGLVLSQYEAANRFSRMQASNFQRRLESVRGHREGRQSGYGFVSETTRFTKPNSDAQSFSLLAAHTYGPPSDAQYTDARYVRQRADSLLTALASHLISAATDSSVNFSYATDANKGITWLPNGIGLWVAGNVRFGNRDEDGQTDRLEFETDGVTVGVDKWFGDRTLLGLGFGYARENTDIGDQGSESDARGVSASVYGTYQLTPQTFINGLAGYGWLDFDTKRYVPSVNAFAQGEREGQQFFVAISAGYEYRRDGYLLSPYTRIYHSSSKLDEYTESGAGMNALTYFDETHLTTHLAAGLRAESIHTTDFGQVAPHVRVEFLHDFEDGNDARIAYADQPFGPRYVLTSLGIDRNAWLISLGSDFLLRKGLNIRFEYELLLSSVFDNDQSFTFQLSKELDDTEYSRKYGSSSALLKNPVRVELGFTSDDNINRSPVDSVSDQFFSIGVSQRRGFQVSERAHMDFKGFVNGSKLHTYNKLDRVSVGVQGDLRYRTSAHFDAVTFRLFGLASLDEYDSNLRSGFRYRIGAGARKSLTDRIDIIGSLAHNFREADSDVFDTQHFNADVHLEYIASWRGLLYFGGEYRNGDTVSSTPDFYYDETASKSEPDDAFERKGFIANQYDAVTWLWSIGYNWRLGSQDSIDLSWKHIRSEPSSDGEGIEAYDTNQFSIFYLMRF